jgi:hypothetical protein
MYTVVPGYELTNPEASVYNDEKRKDDVFRTRERGSRRSDFDPF